MASKAENRKMTNVSHYDNGFLSYPNMRVFYPENELDEATWLAGWYAAKREAEIDIQETGVDTYAWKYRAGD